MRAQHKFITELREGSRTDDTLKRVDTYSDLRLDWDKVDYMR